MQWKELDEFTRFCLLYFRQKVVAFGVFFEKMKDFVVALLIVRRGKYSSSFLNTSFFLLVSAAVIAGPIIVENNPFIGELEDRFGTQEVQSASIAYNPFETSFSTIVSSKPRDNMVAYTVESGDTLKEVSEKFDVSIDTIRWANDLPDETIKEGQVLKIPPITGVVHKVASGETVYSIAKKYKTEAQNIVNFPFNDFEDLDTFALKIGQVLYVPNGIIQSDYVPDIQPQRATVKPGVVGSSSFIWPTSGAITQYPTWYHMALDIADGGSPAIVATDRGTVVFSGCVRYGYGCHVIVDHGNGYQSLYAHLSTISVQAGEAVSQGQALGIMGTTGYSTGIHLHFEIRSGGALLNPQNFLP